jgi:UDP-N-acetylmuramoyl-L-alanyl-D-glutamate--2,6-diaminopimelate ligase
MGAIAAELADGIVLTDDNPRTEPPRAIIDGIAAGIPAGMHHSIESNREAAIRGAVLDASPRDVVVVAGKGHEDYQIYGEERRAFSDQKIVVEALAQRGGAA